MNINLTLLIQAINFWIAYSILRSLVLKPAYELIKKERAIKEKLETEISNVEQRKQFLYEKRYRIWHNGHRLFSQHAPIADVSIPPSLFTPISLPLLADIDQKKLIENMHNEIVDHLKECV